MTAVDEARVVPYSIGICNASACAAGDADQAEVEDWLNLSHPSGISSCWQVSGGSFADGTPNPCECNHDPSRRHWLLEC